MSGCDPSTEDRVAQLADEARALANASREVFESLWPKEMAPRVFSELARRLGDAPNNIPSLQESAARKGAEWALSLMVSWYPAAQPERLAAGLRGSDRFEDLRQRPGIRTTACTIADFVDLEEFIPDRAEEAEDEEEQEPDEGADEGRAKGHGDAGAGSSHLEPADGAATGDEEP